MAKPKDERATNEPATAKPAAPTGPQETGWLPDCVYTGEKFEAGLAFFADGTGRIARFSREPADLAAAKRLPGQAALPGLVNTHSEAWLRVLRGRSETKLRADRDTLGNWREAHERARAALGPEEIYDAAKLAFIEMLLAGITCVGESHFLHRRADGGAWPEPLAAAKAILRAAHDTGIRIALLNGAWARSDFRAAAGTGPAGSAIATAEAFVRETEALRDHIEKNFPADEAWIGVAARNLGAVPLEYLKAVTTYVRAKRLRLHLGLGETAGEREACVAEYGRTPGVLLAEHGLLDKRLTAVHGAFLGEEDIRALGAAHALVCACPAAEWMRMAGGVPAGRLLAAGATLALGTGEAQQINLLEEARLVDAQLRASHERTRLGADAGTALLHLATVAGARSLGAPGGALEVGRPADFFTVNVYDPALAGAAPETLAGAVALTVSPRAIREVWVGARQRVAQWRHPAQSGATTRFVEMQKRIWGA